MSNPPPKQGEPKQLGFLFSFPALALIAVILSGIWLAPHFRLSTRSDQVLLFHIAGRAKISARGSEVVVGLTAFIVTLFLVGMAVGPWVHNTFERQFGVSLGQPVSIFVFSYLAT